MDDRIVDEVVDEVVDDWTQQPRAAGRPRRRPQVAHHAEAASAKVGGARHQGRSDDFAQRDRPLVRQCTVTIGRLRRKVGDPPVMATTPRFGYRIVDEPRTDQDT
ncbi:hypothetical protein [Terrabacter sp. MAHUQ-38]|uniref:hypothetical protein n=1 Tax=unclassified Terrabacter TaxID=2630222 RepID=UPI00165DFB95|nr:hypothetical protein [Terrabacter sp. MAHUQ-38]